MKKGIRFPKMIVEPSDGFILTWLVYNIHTLIGFFGPAVCVEGIETSEMCNIIRDYGIHSFQGFYYSKPISIKELVEKVKDGAECFAK